jgi:hypothetical protein
MWCLDLIRDHVLHADCAIMNCISIQNAYARACRLRDSPLVNSLIFPLEADKAPKKVSSVPKNHQLIPSSSSMETYL